MMHKEPEIVEYMTQNKITILGIADTRKKETGTKQIHDKFVLIWSGVRREDRAKHGVGFVIHHEKAKDLVDTEFISERLLKIGIREGNKTTTFKYMPHAMTPTQMRKRTTSLNNSETPSTTSQKTKTCTS